MISSEAKVKLAGLSIMVLVVIVLIFGSMFTTPDGSVTIISSFGKAHTVAGPGLSFKTPIKDSTNVLSIRPRKLVEEFQGSTLPPENSDSIGIAATLIVSLNWTPVKDGMMELYAKHGTLEQFENVILETRMQEAVKAASAAYSPKNMLGKRAEFSNAIKTNLTSTIGDSVSMAKIVSIQVDNVGFPETYLNEIEAEQIASKEADKALQKTRQKLNENKQIVDLAETEAERRRLDADAEAYEIESKAKANALAIESVGNAELKVLEAKAALVTSALVDLIEMEQWNGVRSTHVLGSDSSVLLNVNKEKVIRDR